MNENIPNPPPPNPYSPDSPSPYELPRNNAKFYPPPPPPPQPSPRSNFWGNLIQSCFTTGCVMLMLPVALGIFVVICAALLPDSGVGSALTNTDSTAFLEKTVRKGTPGGGKIVLITMVGTISGDGSSLEGSGAIRNIAMRIKTAAEDPDVRGILFQIDSPGGGLTASDIVYHEVEKAKKNGKAIVAWIGGLGASGGYYAAAGTDGIVASPTAMIGSIGVIMQRFQVEGLMKMLGIKADFITSADRKDMGSPFRDMTPEERELFQKRIDHFHDRFVTIVAEGRGMDKEAAAKLATGEIYTPDEALANGLIDRIGYADEALSWLEEKAKAKGAQVVVYRRNVGLSDIFGGVDSEAKVWLKETMQDSFRPGLEASWNGLEGATRPERDETLTSNRHDEEKE